MDAASIRIVASDVDGTLTDGGMYYASSGDTCKVFSVKDGIAVKLLSACGVETVLVSSDDSPVIAKRAERLGIECYTGVSDKVSVVEEICRARAFKLEQAAFIGDDLQDYQVMQQVGLACSVGDAHHMVKAVSDFVCEKPGGKAAFREFAEWLIKQSGRSIEQVWDSLDPEAAGSQSEKE